VLADLDLELLSLLFCFLDHVKWISGGVGVWRVGQFFLSSCRGAGAFDLPVTELLVEEAFQSFEFALAW
jgi:hypothetical protein